MHAAPRAILLFLLTAQTAAMAADCPSSDSLYKHIISIANADHSTSNDRLKLLLAFKEDTKNCPSRNDSVYACLLRRIGVAYGQVGDYRKAIDYTQQAITVIRSNWGKPSVNLSHLPNCYYNLQSYYDSTRQEILKRQAIDSCIAVDLRIGGNYFYSSYLIRDKIEFLHKQGDYIRCINYATLVERLFHNSDTNQLKARCVTIIYHANILIILKKYDEALDLLNREMPTFIARNEYIGSVYTLIGIINFYRGSYSEALATFHKSIEFHSKIHYKPGIAEAYHWIGFIYTEKFNQPRTGLKYYFKGLKEASPIDAVPILTEIGKTYSLLKSFDSAFHSFQLAFDMISPGANETSVINDFMLEKADETTLNYVTSLLISKGNTSLEYYKLKGDKSKLQNAINVYMVADKLLNNLQSLQLELGSKLFWRDNTRRLYENAIESSFLDNDTESAFYFFERSRSAILNAQLNEQRWMPDKEMILLSDLKKDIYQRERLLEETNKSTAGYVSLQKDILENKERLERMQQDIRTRYPLYYQRYIDTTNITILDVQKKLLQHHQALVELFQGDSAVFVLIIQIKKASLQKIDKASFEQLSKRFINFISNVEHLNSGYDEFLTVSHQLYNLIFQNANLPDGRIILSPDGKYFPFEALVSTIKPTVYFLEDHAVSYTYSVKYLLHSQDSDVKNFTKANFLGIAPIRFNSGLQLSALNGSDESLRKIDGYFSNSSNLVADRATRKNFLDQFHSYRIIQLYTHATDSGATGEPMIYFSDSALSLSELIYGRKPMTSLVVLSACQTALGKLYNGEGVFNFNRGFAAMGVPSSISNLWLIETQATYRLTELFYKHLATGLAADLALQKAKKEFMSEGESRRNQLPYLWAASILVGDSNFAIQEKTFPWKWLLIIIPLLILFALWKRKTAEKSS